MNPILLALLAAGGVAAAVAWYRQRQIDAVFAPPPLVIDLDPLGAIDPLGALGPAPGVELVNLPGPGLGDPATAAPKFGRISRKAIAAMPQREMPFRLRRAMQRAYDLATPWKMRRLADVLEERGWGREARELRSVADVLDGV